MNNARTKQTGWSAKGVGNTRFFLRFIAFLFLGKILLSCAGPKTEQAKVAEGKAAEPSIRVCLSENLQSSTLVFEGSYLLELEEARYHFDKSIGTLNVFIKDGDLVIKNDRRNFELPSTQAVVFKPEHPGHRFIWNGIPYSGELWFQITGLQIVVVNKVPMESYLQGVVPFEIPTSQDEYQEAIYAQTIAARSYALYRMEHPSSDFYDVWGDSRDQIYQGTLRSSPMVEKAVSATRGIALANSSQASIAYFHSTCGGVLEVGSDSARSSFSSAGVFAYDLTDNEDNCKLSPYYRWVEVRSLENILWNISKEFHVDSLLVLDWLEKGCRLDIEITQRRQSGRVEKMNFRIENYNFPVEGFMIRKIFADQTGKLLPSNFFFFNESPENRENFYIIGAGAGHGKGMCQWGAIGLALKGYTHQNILGYYYPDLGMVKFY